ncbi:unnamed protein product [Colias eurytheme]|nr:unnamed protein product [Colias eurytheme]
MKGSSGTVPSINNWVKTIENMELLRDKLFYDYKIKSFWCRHLNQDPLENFCGSIRSHRFRINSPSCAAFEAAFASLLVNNMSSNYSRGSKESVKFKKESKETRKKPVGKRNRVFNIRNASTKESIINAANQHDDHWSEEENQAETLQEVLREIRNLIACIDDLKTTVTNKMTTMETKLSVQQDRIQSLQTARRDGFLNTLTLDTT